VKSFPLLRSFSFVIAAALRLGFGIRAVRGLLTFVVAGITLPAGSALFAQQVTTLAGSGQSGSIDGTGTMATFTGPTGVAVGADGTVYVADNVSNKIRKITAAGVVTTLAGSGASGRTDGTGTMASFDSPWGVAVGPDGAVYVTDSFSGKVRKITAQGAVTTLGGQSFLVPYGGAVGADGAV